MELELFMEQVRQRIGAKMDDAGELSLLCPPKAVADDVTKLLIRDGAGKPAAVALCAAATSPQLVARAVNNAAQAREKLGAVLGRHVPVLSMIGEVDGRSVAVLPYFHPLANSAWQWFWQRRALRPVVFEWLYKVTQATIAPATDEQSKMEFLRCLRFVADNANFSAAIREAAGRAAQRLERGAWKPAYVLAHNDLWKENILLDLDHRCSNGSAKSDAERFMLIDWAGAKMKGFAIYDLLRLGRSFSLSASQLAGELRRHCQLLQCDLIDAESHLLSSIGSIGLNLEHFPPDRYARSMERCRQTLCETIGIN